MEILKFIMLVLIFITFILIGRIMSKKYVLRLKELEAMKNALNMFKTKIKFTYDPIPEIFNEIAQKTSIKNISDIFTNAKNNMKKETAQIAWEKAIEESKEMNLNKEDKEIIKMLSKLLRTN